MNYVFEVAKFDFIDHLNVIIDLAQGEYNLWKAMKKQRRSGIRRAIRSGNYCEEVEIESEMKELNRSNIPRDLF